MAAQNIHSHARVTLLDNDLRTCWYRAGNFGLSKALLASARLKRLRDSSSPPNAQASQPDLFAKA